jgi:hypothetical protein
MQKFGFTQNVERFGIFIIASGMASLFICSVQVFKPEK